MMMYDPLGPVVPSGYSSPARSLHQVPLEGEGLELGLEDSGMKVVTAMTKNRPNRCVLSSHRRSRGLSYDQSVADGMVECKVRETPKRQLMILMSATPLRRTLRRTCHFGLLYCIARARKDGAPG
jgi:hypothetical protein